MRSIYATTGPGTNAHQAAAGQAEINSANAYATQTAAGQIAAGQKAFGAQANCITYNLLNADGAVKCGAFGYGTPVSSGGGAYAQDVVWTAPGGGKLVCDPQSQACWIATSLDLTVGDAGATALAVQQVQAADDRNYVAAQIDNLALILAGGVSGDDPEQAGVSAGTEAEEGLSGTQLARQLGLEGEQAAGVDPAVKIQIPSMTGTASFRVPDIPPDEVSFGEVKNVRYQAFTSQIQDFTYYGAQNNLRFDLIVRENTVLSAPLEDIINMTGSPINLIRGLPPG